MTRYWLLLWLTVPLLNPTPAAPEAADAAPGWPDGLVPRLEAQLLLQTLNADLLSHDSATVTLEHWCAEHRLASPPRVVAERVPGTDKAPTEEQRRELGVTAGEPVRYRRVRLRCGDLVLSEADNWYVPARLTADMNHALDSSDVPFGRVVQPLHFRRHTISAKLLAQLLPEGWEMSADRPAEPAGSLPLPAQVLEHRALLTLPEGTPISEVVETYTANVLAFPMPNRQCRCVR
jgi:chorismate-pyruvate lyase